MSTHPRVRDVTIVFFTDGEDCSMQESLKSLEKLQDLLNKEEKNFRFFTIGFSASHDAVFLNKIAQAGSEVGNFTYIDT